MSKGKTMRMRCDTIDNERNRLVIADWDNAECIKRVTFDLDHGTVRALAYALREWTKKQRDEVSHTEAVLKGAP